MGTFSFDAGGVHWTVLDSNPHVRWDDPALIAWLARDLYQARDADWRFVVFHHPAFNFSDGNRYVDQWMARIWPLLERSRVDLVFTGHVHTYARTQPIRFTPDPASLAALDPRSQQGQVQGQLVWDTGFDGRERTRADGVIHLITGGGGAHLHLKGKHGIVPKPYVAKIISQEHSFSVLDIKGKRLEFRQLGGDGRVLDRFVLTK
jgi:3',5'-cyclic AMP phosphodiesterase CpdA